PAGGTRPVALPAARAALHLGPVRRGELPVRGRRGRGDPPAPQDAGARAGDPPHGLGHHAGRPAPALPTVRSGDEFDTLAQTLNGMLDHIEYLIAGISNVSNSIAHDLRTPLAELRSRLEELATTRPPPGETFTEIDAAVADVDRVMRIFSALLRLAEIDSGARRSGFVPVD